MFSLKKAKPYGNHQLRKRQKLLKLIESLAKELGLTVTKSNLNGKSEETAISDEERSLNSWKKWQRLEHSIALKILSLGKERCEKTVHY